MNFLTIYMQKYNLPRFLFDFYIAVGIRNPACQNADGHRRGSGKGQT